MKKIIIPVLLSFILTACGGGSSDSSSSVTPTVTPTPTPTVTPTPTPVVNINNTVALSVNKGINGNYLNGLFGSVTVCQPNTAKTSPVCQTVDNILFDTGSIGLRLAADALPSTFNLPFVTDTSGNKIAECMHFADGVAWGTVNTADVQLGGEIATNIPIQIISSNSVSVPTACSNSGPVSSNSVTLGSKGVMGIGLFQQDCGISCQNIATTNTYYNCSSNGCVQTTLPVTAQISNPIISFPQDNNGTIVSLNNIPSNGSINSTGNLYIGIGTQSNNTTSLQVINTDNRGYFTINYKNVNYPDSFIDSGSSVYSFTDSSIPLCTTGNSTGLYCPNNPLVLPFNFINLLNNSSTTTSINLDNATNLLSTSNSAFNNIGFPSPNLSSTSVDFGLPFFYGKNVATGIEGKSSNLGTGTYVAF